MKRTCGVLWRGPLHLAFRLSGDRTTIDRDIKRCLQPRLDLPLLDVLGLRDADIALAQRSFRSLFYFRLRMCGPVGRIGARLLSLVYPPESPLYLSCPSIGPGLYISHGFATILNAQSVGQDCLLAQQVTVGWSNKGGPPTIGNRVRICAGATVIGPIHIGDDAVIGANALVIHDVPARAVVGGVPAKIIGYGHIEDRSLEGLKTVIGRV